LISWKSKKQKSVSRSSCEAKYRALANATCEAQWLKNLLKAFCISHRSPTVIFCNNDSAIHIANNPVFHERTKHIDMDCHIVRDKVEEGVVHLMPIQTKEQIADLLTKPLGAAAFYKLKAKLGLKDIYNPCLRGNVSIGPSL
jgi:hypothetical protein